MQTSEFLENSEVFLSRINLLLYKSLRTRINDQLRTAEQGQGLPAGFVRHLCIPDLGGASVVHARRKAGKRPFAGGAREIALELDSGEVLRPCGQVGECPVTAGGIRDGDYHGRVQVTVGG